MMVCDFSYSPSIVKETPHNSFIFPIKRINDSKSQVYMVFASGKQTFIKPEAQKGYRPNIGFTRANTIFN